MNDLTNIISPMKNRDELISELAVFPNYDEKIRLENQAVRLTALSDLYDLYIPSQMSLEIYNKLYLALLRSLHKKSTKIAIQQQYENHKAVIGQKYNGIIGGSDSFTIIGSSGIGKSTAISRAISLITENRIIELKNPYTKVVLCIVVQCPFDCSVKGLLLEVLRKVDEELGSRYYQNALRARATTDMLIGSVSQVALNHIGMLIVDEIQNVVSNKNGKSLIGALTQLINNSGVSIGMVGTPECTTFFESAMQLARRSVGLQYGAMSYDAYFKNFCKVLFDYQFVTHKSELTDSVIEWLYEHSAGVTSIVVSLIHDGQEMAILNGKETLDLDILNAAYKQRLSLVHGYIEPSMQKKKSTSDIKPKNKVVSRVQAVEVDNKISITALAQKSKNEGIDIVPLLKKYFQIAEVAI